ncbi:peptide chain release factor 1 [Oculatella sp. FACHB-28]|uniref:peptide chain release factor 1 n=1 Tax=Cyanophyceae TaxID=3028117 RepID=UPI001687F437|nr:MULTISPECIES: peptide chain release factor 1 [Cyanophyceae]MBD1870785.1 peptide chain release factor 1 [Cyanobacteria bacterium FACHB-471]MBD2056539.1 peptide chain release factor 1 [Oculatella sp. FACHB-28]MBD2069109.1 peptide chain release factor 1 [Leptolyngbya sp. FACHB-671]
MSNPLRRLKFLPWLPLFQVAALATGLAFVVEILLIAGTQFSPIAETLEILFQPPLALFVLLAAAVGLGALATLILERFHQRVVINTSVLWALILCVMVMLMARSLLQLPVLFLAPDYMTLMGVLLGVFWQGKAYWR